MRDSKWLFDLAGLIILISVLYIGLKEVVSFVTDIIKGILIIVAMVFGMIFGCFIFAIVINFIVVLVFTALGLYNDSYPFVSVILIICIAIVAIKFVSYIGDADDES